MNSWKITTKIAFNVHGKNYSLLKIAVRLPTKRIVLPLK
jgi:hypothetical protein